MDFKQSSVAEAIARARAKIAADNARKEAANQPAAVLNIIDAAKELAEQQVVRTAASGLVWNDEQAAAIRRGVKRESFCLIGAAGTGKTTTLKGTIAQMQADGSIQPLDRGTKWLVPGAPGVVLVSFTRRAVRNIARQMPLELRSHCLTIHALLEFAPEFFEVEVTDDKGIKYWKKTRRFVPNRNRSNPLPRTLKTIVIDEASMVDTELMAKLRDALPHWDDICLIVLGDLNQLPPVYGQAILGHMLLEKPIIELTKVYRQALESPIISIALAVKNNDFHVVESDINSGTFTVNGKPRSPYDPSKINLRNVTEKITIERAGRGKVTLHPWKIKLDQDDALRRMQKQINLWINEGTYNPEEDVILCPWGKPGIFSSYELNQTIADKLGKMRGAEIYEVIAGFQKYYLAAGDKLMVNKQDAIILRIERNFKYTGQRPKPHSKDMDRWGNLAKDAVVEAEELSDEEFDNILESLSADIEDRVHEASHRVWVRMLDTDEEVCLDKAADLNNSQFGYCMSVHKAQGSEWRRVFLITHYCHAQMCSRELIYTAVTRASEELYVVMSPMMLSTSAGKPRVKGNTLKEKLAWFEKERQKLLVRKASNGDGDYDE